MSKYLNEGTLTELGLPLSNPLLSSLCLCIPFSSKAPQIAPLDNSWFPAEKGYKEKIAQEKQQEEEKQIEKYAAICSPGYRSSHL